MDANKFGLKIGTAALALGLMAGAASAQTIPNSNFSITGSSSLSSSNSYLDTGGTISGSTALPSWTASGAGYACVALSGSITTAGSYCGTSGGQPALVFTTSPGSVAAGYTGNIFIDDAGGNGSGGSFNDTITTTITGLVAGKTYSLSFYYSGAQQSGFTGQTQDWWDVGFNGATPTQVTPSITVGANSGGTPPTDTFQKQSVNFTVAAGQTTETVSFLAAGNGNTGSNEPPYLMLADLSVAAAPEPASIAILGAGLAGLLGYRKRARARA